MMKRAVHRSTSSWPEALEQALTDGVDVVNLSIGGGYVQPVEYSPMPPCSWI